MIQNFIQSFEWTKFYSLKAGMHCMPCIHWRYAPALADARGRNTRIMGDFRLMGLVLHAVCPQEMIA